MEPKKLRLEMQRQYCRDNKVVKMSTQKTNTNLNQKHIRKIHLLFGYKVVSRIEKLELRSKAKKLSYMDDPLLMIVQLMFLSLGWCEIDAQANNMQ